MMDNVKSIKAFDIFDFELDNNALITFLKNYGEFSKLEIIQSTDDNLFTNKKFILIEWEYIIVSAISKAFPNIEIIVDPNISCGSCKIILL